MPRQISAVCSAAVLGFLLTGCAAETQTDSASKGNNGRVLPKLSDVSPAFPAPVGKPKSFNLAAGTRIPVRLMTVLDTLEPYLGFAMGAVAEDVKGADGRLAIPANTQAAVVVREASKTNGISVLRLGLYSINVDGHQWILSDGAKEAADVTFTDDAARGFSHGSVHLGYGSRVDFRVSRAARFK